MSPRAMAGSYDCYDDNNLDDIFREHVERVLSSAEDDLMSFDELCGEVAERKAEAAA